MKKKEAHTNTYSQIDAEKKCIQSAKERKKRQKNEHIKQNRKRNNWENKREQERHK